MNNYFVYATMLDSKTGAPYVHEHLIKVENTGRKFSWKDTPDVVVYHYYRLAKVLTGGEIPADKLREFSLSPDRVMEFPNDEAAMLWYRLRN
jgi:hypothetical protein